MMLTVIISVSVMAYYNFWLALVVLVQIPVYLWLTVKTSAKWQKIEKEKGFDGVWELLDSGPYDKAGEKYFATLEKLTGINKSNFNDKVWELINTEHRGINGG